MALAFKVADTPADSICDELVGPGSQTYLQDETRAWGLCELVMIWIDKWGNRRRTRLRKRCEKCDCTQRGASEPSLIRDKEAAESSNGTSHSFAAATPF